MLSKNEQLHSHTHAIRQQAEEVLQLQYNLLDAPNNIMDKDELAAYKEQQLGNVETVVRSILRLTDEIDALGSHKITPEELDKLEKGGA